MAKDGPCKHQVKAQKKFSQGGFLKPLEQLCAGCRCMQGERSCNPDGYEPLEQSKENIYGKHGPYVAVT